MNANKERPIPAGHGYKLDNQAPDRDQPEGYPGHKFDGDAYDIIPIADYQEKYGCDYSDVDTETESNQFNGHPGYVFDGDANEIVSIEEYQQRLAERAEKEAQRFVTFHHQTQMRQLSSSHRRGKRERQQITA